MSYKHLTGAVFGTVITALLFSPGPVQAQVLEEIVVSAQRREQSLQDVPISVLAISGDDIDRQGFKDLRDLSEFAPTVRVDDGQAISPTISIRGFGTTGTSATLESAAPIFVDNIHFSRLSMVKIGFLDVEAIEILKGPQPVYFGQNATAGAISIRSRRPTPEWEGNISFEYGDRQQHTMTTAAGGPITDTLGIRGALTYTNDPGPITHFITQQKVGQWENVGGRISLLWQPTDQLSILGKVDRAVLDRDIEAHAICYRQAALDTASPGNYAPGERLSGAALVPPPNGNGWIVPHTPLGIDDCYTTRVGTSAGGPYYAPPVESRTRDSTTGHLDVRLAAQGFVENSFVAGFWEEQTSSANINPYEDVDTTTATIVVNYAFDNEISLEWTTGYVDFFREYARDNQNDPFFSNWQSRREDYSQWSTELRFSSATGGMFEWEVGGFWQLGDLDSFSSSLRANMRDPQRFNKVWEDQEWRSVFGVLTFNFLDNRASIDLGARYSNLRKETLAMGYGATWVYDVRPCRPTPQDWQGGGNFDVETCPTHPAAVQITAADNPRIFVPNADMNNLWTIPYDSPNNRLGRHVPSNWRGNRAAAIGMTAPCFSICRSDSGPHLGDFSASEIDPQVVLRYRHTDNMSFYARYATAYKAGGFDTGQASLAQNVPTGLPEGFEFLPEFATTYEAGVKGTFLDGRGRYDINLFELEFTNIQISVSAANPDSPGSTQNINAGAQRTRGVEFLFAYAFTEQFRGAFGGALMDGVMSSFPDAPCTPNEVATAPASGCVVFGVPTGGLLGTGGVIDRSGLKVPNTPDWKFTLDLDYWMPVLNDYRLGLNAKGWVSDGYCGQFGDCGITRWPVGHGDFNLSASIGDMNQDWELSLYARNFLHPNQKRYAEEADNPLGGISTVSITPSRYLNYGVKLTYNFF